ncbi:RNA-directed DNA polymerase (Reverse transcriptase) [Trifolium medium]|uniref:RNA-directed DNA polymerase (Reverse transcriptase) n=1 Tax=Trifolium medium TaxID=97028 RepID=A0A392P440_9FABA|nr:RNA-directed DNA polymerase (Reverse transcriptase) [Trifolium medium]
MSVLGARTCPVSFRYAGVMEISEHLKISGLSIIHTKLMALILAMEIAHRKQCHYLWLESDSKASLHTFDNSNVVSWDLRNRWLNCMNYGLHLYWSHICRDGDSCADKLANMGHAYVQMEWWDSLPAMLHAR